MDTPSDMMPSTMLLPLRVYRGTKGQLHSPEEWDEQKQEIQTLYIDENRTLEEVVAIMGRKGFRASAKQFRDRLKRWNLTKYRKAPDTSKSDRPSAGADDDDHDRNSGVVGLVGSKNRSVEVYNALRPATSNDTPAGPSDEGEPHDPTTKTSKANTRQRKGASVYYSLLISLLHANNASRHVHIVVVSAYNYIAASFDNEEGWQGVHQGMLVGGYEHPFIQEFFQRAVRSYIKYPNDTAAFGRMTRQGFLEAERILAHARPHMTVLALFYIPWLLAWTNHVDVCAMYLQHVCSLLRERQHEHSSSSLLDVGQAVQDLLRDAQQRRGGRLEVDEFLSSLADIVQAWLECYKSMEPRDEFPDLPSRTHLWMEACTEFMRGRRPREIINANVSGVAGLGTLSAALLASSAGGDGDGGGDLLATQSEADLTLLQAISHTFLDGFEAGAHDILRRAGATTTTTTTTNTTTTTITTATGTTNAQPGMTDTRLQCWRALADHCEARRDWDRVVAYRALCCEVGGDRRDVYLLFELEQTLRRLGRDALADETGRKRRAFEVRLGLRDFEWRGTTWDRSSVMMTLLSSF